MLQNSRLGKGKCKAEEQILHFPALERKKLDSVGDSSRFDTDRSRWEDEREKGGSSITLYYSSGNGLSAEGAAGYTFTMQLSQAKEFREGNSSLIRHIVYRECRCGGDAVCQHGKTEETYHFQDTGGVKAAQGYLLRLRY